MSDRNHNPPQHDHRPPGADLAPGDSGAPSKRASELVAAPGQTDETDSQMIVVTQSMRFIKGDEEFDYGAQLAAGTMIGGCRIVDTLGRGGCGTVYEAVREDSGRRVAVKVLHSYLAASPQHVQRFLRESEAMQRIRHRGVVEILGTGALDDGRPYMIMELVIGISLSEWIDRRGRLSPTEALELMELICDPLTCAHEAGIVHRDIKSSNVMLRDPPGAPDASGAGPTVKLLDFGLAKLIDPDGPSGINTSVGLLLGSPHTMAPEQVLGQPVDVRTDVYALGVLLFRMLTGRFPFMNKNSILLAQMQVHAAPPPPSKLAPVGPGLDAVVARAMAKAPAERYDSVADFLAGLRRAVHPNPADATKDTTGSAFALYVDARVAEDEALDDDLFMELMAVLDTTEAIFDGAGVQTALQTGQTLVGVVPITDTAVVHRSALIALARELELQLASCLDPHSRLHVNICLHRAEATLRTVDGARQVIGGPVLELGDWAPLEPYSGIMATPAAMSTSPALETIGAEHELDPLDESPRYLRIDS
ncbi:serine/threonine-protein kinase [Haliangium sp.]|uniref:serine/threonine-protein kinase n=1 Tax=Haliangium sp. TaxID=2663208 RepID=UPI003D0F25F2